jgi:formyltetrahydrofolate synthetase
MTIKTPKEMFINAGKTMNIAGGGSSIILSKTGIDLLGKEVRQN